MSTQIGQQPLLQHQSLKSPQQQDTQPQQQQVTQPQRQQVAQPQLPQVAQPQHQQVIQPQQQQVVYHGCCNPIARTLPVKLRTATLAIGSCMLINGLACLIIGIVGFFTTNSYYYYHHPMPNHVVKRTSIAFYYNISVYTGHNIWVGIPYMLCGIFAIVSQKSRLNHHLVNTFFAFSIISFILAIPHFGISLGTMFNWYHSYGIWFNIISIVMSVIGFVLSLTCIIILGHHVYCAAASSNAVTVFYQGAATQPITIQQYPGQMGPTYTPAQPVYMQAAATPQASITTKVPLDQIAQPPQYTNLKASANAQNPENK